jgi:energy-coupling factor transporter ATP-binding protein EcfA2
MEVNFDAPPKIEVRDLHFAVGDREILKGITLSIAPAEILCVMGVSGGGKSTLIRNIAGLIRPTQGEILIDGEETSRLAEDELIPHRREDGRRVPVCRAVRLDDGVRKHRVRDSARPPATAVQEIIASGDRPYGRPTIARSRPCPASNGGFRRNFRAGCVGGWDSRVLWPPNPK